MKSISLYNNDGTLSTQAQLLLSPRPADMSRAELRKILKEFRYHLSKEDVKEFDRLKVTAWTKAYHQRNKEKRRASQKAYYQQNKERLITYNKEYHQQNKEELKACGRAYYQQNKEKRRAYYQQNKEKIKAYRKKNKKRYTKRNKKYRKERAKRDPLFAAKEKLRRTVRRSFKRIKQNKPTDTLELLGCSWEEAKAHIESLWQEGMSWENHGRCGWHIDHIRPVSSFKEDEIHLMNRIENLQPLWWQDNLSKGNKLQDQVWFGLSHKTSVL